MCHNIILYIRIYNTQNTLFQYTCKQRTTIDASMYTHRTRNR